MGRLPRSVHRAVLRVLWPAESAVRRLIIIAARGLVVKLKPAPPISHPDAGGAHRQGQGTPLPPSSSSISGKTSPAEAVEGPRGIPRVSISSEAMGR